MLDRPQFLGRLDRFARDVRVANLTESPSPEEMADLAANPGRIHPIARARRDSFRAVVEVEPSVYAEFHDTAYATGKQTLLIRSESRTPCKLVISQP